LLIRIVNILQIKNKGWNLMKAKTFLFILILLLSPIICLAAEAEQPQTAATQTSTAAPQEERVIRASTGARPEPTYRDEMELKKSYYYDEISIAIGIPAIRISFGNGQVGAFDLGAMFVLSFQPRALQSKTKRNQTYAVWSFGLGAMMQRNQVTGRFDFGVALIPYQFRYENFALGVGVALMTNENGKLAFSMDNLHLIIPFSIYF
jgi:hypothetical protein